jgi:serine/threonine-protein kinase
VYSLGVVLYELLAGQPPYRLTTRSPQQLAELICERDPERPSVVIGRASETARSVAATHDTTIDRLQRALRGDLDEIVLKALRKEAGRRYGSAELLAQDITRHLEGLPVLAQRGSRRYRATKFIRRHRVEAAAVAVVSLSLLTGAGLAFWQASVARTERDRAAAALVQVEQTLEQAQEMSRFLTSLFEASEPAGTSGAELSARDLLRRGIRRAEELGNQPIVQAAMFDVLGRVQNSLGEFADARRLFERALELRVRHRGDYHAEVAATLYQLAVAQHNHGLFAEAEASSLRGLAILERDSAAPPAELADMLILASGLAVYRGDLHDADSLARRAVQVSDWAPASDGLVRVRALIQDASVDRRQVQLAAAESKFRRALDIARRAFGPYHPDAIEPLLRLGYLFMDQPERLADAETIFVAAIKARQKALGADHYLLGHVYRDLGLVLQRQRRHQEALSYYRQGLSIIERSHGPDHPLVASAKNFLGGALDRAGQYAEAEQMYRESIALAKRTYGEHHTRTAGAIDGLASVLMHRGKLEEAERLSRRAISIRLTLGGPNTPLMALMNGNLAEILIRKGDFPQAESLLKQAATILDSYSIPHQNIDYRVILTRFVLLYDAWKKPELASRYRSLL